MRTSEFSWQTQPLKNRVLRLLKDEGKQRFCQIAERTNQKGDKHVHSVKTANCLKALLGDKLIERKYVERASWYEITNEGRNYLQKISAVDEVRVQQAWGFSNCEVVKCSDGKGDASVYWSHSVDEETKEQISEILMKYKGIKIIGHYGLTEEP